MKKIIFIVFWYFQSINAGSIRNIFEYDHDWLHADYVIIAHGHIHETDKAFKVLQCGSESKVVREK